MMDDVNNGLVGAIIVKDMSRFGRDYIMVGYYTEIMLPQMDIRFIAVNDNVDSENQADNDFTHKPIEFPFGVRYCCCLR